MAFNGLKMAGCLTKRFQTPVHDDHAFPGTPIPLHSCSTRLQDALKLASLPERIGRAMISLIGGVISLWAVPLPKLFHSIHPRDREIGGLWEHLKFSRTCECGLSLRLMLIPFQVTLVPHERRHGDTGIHGRRAFGMPSSPHRSRNGGTSGIMKSFPTSSLRTQCPDTRPLRPRILRRNRDLHFLKPYI